MKKGKNGLYAKYIKRILDIVCAALAMILFFLLFALIAVLVRMRLGKPVIFQQVRPGKNGKPFALYKFRTMTDQKDSNGRLLPDNLRLTPFGAALRKTSLDELPEIWNILIGDMSIVGPRPLLMEYLPYYTAEEAHRHDVRPGLTGLAQINGRNFIDWDARIAKDVEYVKNISFFLDLTIVAKTAFQMIAKKNIAENTNEVEGNFAEIRKKQATR